MFFGLFSRRKRRIGKRELETLRTAERITGISLVATYERLSKENRAVFLKDAERVNRERAEYLDLKAKFGV